MNGIERRAFGLEVRAEGRRLSGTVMRYGDISPSHRERFSPGSLKLAAAVPVNLHHDREKAIGWHPGGGVKIDLDRTGVRLAADLPPIPAADRALAEVRSGRATGLSAEFICERESTDAGIRVIEAATLHGIGIVRNPSYPAAGVEARARSGKTLSVGIPTGRPVQCECAGGGCSESLILGEMMADAYQEIFTEGTRRTVAAYLENYSTPIASTSRGTLRGRIVGAGGYEVDIDLPESEAGRRLLDAWQSAGIIVRPFIDRIEGEISDGVQTIRKGRLRAFIVSSTDAREGWPEPKIAATPAAVLDQDAPPAPPPPDPDRAARPLTRNRWVTL